MIRHSLATLIAYAAVCISYATPATAHAINLRGDQADAPRLTRGRSSRLLERRKKQRPKKEAEIENKLHKAVDERHLESDGDGNLEIIYEAALDNNLDGSSGNPCQSIIAVDGFRLLSTDSIVDDFDYYPDANVSIAYEANEEVVTDETFICELANGSTIPLQGTDEQLIEMRQLLNHGILVSSVSSVEALHTDGVAEGGNDAGLGMVTLPPGGIKLITDNKSRRKLGETNKREGTKQILIVKVTDKYGLAVDEDAHTISDKFFGTYGDKVTLASGFNACSFGKLTMTDAYDVNTNLLSAPGVLEVRIPISIQRSTNADIANAARSAAEVKLGMHLPGPIAHMIFIVESCYTVDSTCRFAAYAYVNHWFSLFVDDNWKYPAVAMHELGHNFGIAHSGGMYGETYTDHTCLMGNPDRKSVV